MDESTMYLIPLSELSVRDPNSRNILPQEGMFVPWTGPEGRYWRRRVADGSCKIASPPEIKKDIPASVPVQAEENQYSKKDKGGMK